MIYPVGRSLLIRIVYMDCQFHAGKRRYPNSFPRYSQFSNWQVTRFSARYMFINYFCLLSGVLWQTLCGLVQTVRICSVFWQTKRWSSSWRVLTIWTLIAVSRRLCGLPSLYQLAKSRTKSSLIDKLRFFIRKIGWWYLILIPAICGCCMLSCS